MSPSVTKEPSPLSAEYSVQTWKRVPSTWEVFFGLQLPYRPPKSSLGAFVWRKRLWFESTFAFTMLQPWEKVVLFSILSAFLILFSTGLFLYFPTHLAIVFSRAKYYLSGDLSPSPTKSDAFGTSVDKGRSYVMGVLSDYGENAYAGLVAAIHKLVDTWRASGFNDSLTGAGSEL